MKKLIMLLALLIVPFINAQDWITATIDSGATVSTVITTGSLHPIAVTVDTPWTTANLNIQVWDAYNKAYRLLKDETGATVVITITSPPATYGFLPKVSWWISDKFRFVSTTAQLTTDSTNVRRTLKIKRGQIE